jgi:hypothetical protein
MRTALRRGRAWLILGAAVSAVAGLSILIGFVGAPLRQEFDWRLCAEIATALGTVLLAIYTAWLATTTRAEVGASIEEQRARDRPIVVVSLTDVGGTALDPTTSQSVPILVYWLKNVGLGPALDLHIWATYRGERVPTDEVISVVAPGEEISNRPLSLTGLREQTEGFVLNDFELGGDFEDRTRIERHRVTVLFDKGLRDEQRAARAIANKRAWLRLAAGSLVGISESRRATYRPQVLNNGPAVAHDVRLQLVDEERRAFSDEVWIGKMRAPSQEEAVVEARAPHPRLSCSLWWRDGLGEQEELFEFVYPPVWPEPDDDGDLGSA